MASIGRGRGRGVLISRPSADPKVGRKEEKEPGVSLDEISKGLKRLDVAPDDEHIQKTCNMMTKYMTDEQNMSKVTELLYAQCCIDRDFTYAASKLINELQGVDIKGVKFRNCFLTLLQKEFEGKDKLRAASVDKFLALVALLCQMFGTVRVGNKEVMQILTGPIFQCLGVIVTNGNEEEVECLQFQMEGIGKLLEEKTPNEMAKLMNKLRQSIVSHKTSARVRCMLLELLEMWYNRWQPLPPGTANFYADLFSESLLLDS